MSEVKGRVHSIQSMGTVDGPGVRFVVFMQGCNLRCKCCHNPDTWDYSDGTEYTASEIVEKASHYKEYFGEKGGITLSGGEPILQAKFAKEVFTLCHENGINTCLDTSGSFLNDDVKSLLNTTDRALLDIKYTDDKSYVENVGCHLSPVLEFLSYLDNKGIPTTLRQVVIPTINDNEENILKLKAIADAHKCVDKIELLPFKNICKVKYDKMGIDFPFDHIRPADNSDIKNLQQHILSYI
ncbi:MAG: pyruvate formate lyase-activating protein [Ruminococcus sp.]|nr:pyruvate formate lyase-activating protein [Ruminococcus sp.]